MVCIPLAAAGTGCAGGARRRARGPGFTLVELIVVLTVLGVISSLVPLTIRGFSKSRRSAILELCAVLDTARTKAITEQTDVYVAFADESPPRREDWFTRYALFVPRAGLESGTGEEDTGILQREVTGASNWFRLPEGVLFALGREFDVGGDAPPFRTILDAGEEGLALKRRFPFPGAKTGLELPFFLFNAHGQLEFPPLYREAFHHVGVVEAVPAEEPQRAGSRGGSRSRVYLGWRNGPAGKWPRTELVSIHAYHGRPILLTAGEMGSGRGGGVAGALAAVAESGSVLRRNPDGGPGRIVRVQGRLP